MTVEDAGLASSTPRNPGMDRRRFLLTSLASALTKPLVTEAQSPAARVGLLGPGEEPRFSEIASARLRTPRRAVRGTAIASRRGSGRYAVRELTGGAGFPR
jgi:hypothetical protein